MKINAPTGMYLTSEKHKYSTKMLNGKKKAATSAKKGSVTPRTG